MMTELKQRINYLELVKKEKEEALKTAPEGALRVSRHGGRVEFYRRMVQGKGGGVYLSKQEMELVKRLAQKGYDRKVLLAAEQELAILYYCKTEHPPVRVEDIYDQLTDVRKELVKPIVEPDDLFVKNWETLAYSGKEIEKPEGGFRTLKGETVRSKSELIIANILYSNSIPYRYEYPIKLKGMGTVHPDFCVLNIRTRQEYLWEHLGMMDDEKYVERNIRKIRCYEKNGYYLGENLLITYETKNVSIDVDEVRWMINHYLK